MTIILINRTGTSVTVELNNDKIELNNNERIDVDIKTNNIRFNCFLNESSTFKHLPLSKSVIVEYNFVLNSAYDLTVYNDNCEINLVKKQIKGDNLEQYRFVDLQFSSGCIKYKEFFVQDEMLAKEQLSVARKKEIKLEKRLRIIDILQTICYIGIPALIIFLGLWYYIDFKTALIVIIPLSIIGIVIGLLLKKIISKFNNKLDKINSKFEKANDKYVDVNSFFDKNYINSILNNN